MPSEKNANTCIYRYTRQTILPDSEKMRISREGIPGEGLCSVKRNREGFLPICDHLLPGEICPRRNNSDFCNEPWAK